jgi:hypothetical protein
VIRLLLDCDGVDVITHELIGDLIRIGRAPSNDLVIDDPTVSAQHASLTKSPGGYRLKDLGSTNGTQINGVSITEAGLKDGAEIRIGYVTGVFRDAIASIDQVRKLQVPGERDRPAQIRLSETQSILRPRAQWRVNHRDDASQERKIARPLEFTAPTQPQLQPALLRLSAMISQYFTRDGFCLFWSPHSNDKTSSNRKPSSHDNWPAGMALESKRLSEELVFQVQWQLATHPGHIKRVAAETSLSLLTTWLRS